MRVRVKGIGLVLGWWLKKVNTGMVNPAMCHGWMDGAPRVRVRVRVRIRIRIRVRVRVRVRIRVRVRVKV